ncbi:uncharacterized protein [Hyperolius riggenbachi]|uniref:uncharacterized protein n=1 Tax=Hyperolius riggenbachi TaxID=752182 RepID=UPI0035A26C2E
MAVDIFSDSQFTREFIDLYRAHPALWKTKTKCYSDRRLKAKAHDELVQLCKTVLPEADVQFVKNKIQNLRTVFKKELNKIERSKRSGAAAEEVYKPRLWYYDLLAFTIPHLKGREAICSLSSEPTDLSINSEMATGDKDPNLEEEETSVAGPSQESTKRRFALKKTRKRRNVLEDKCEEAIQQAVMLINKKDDSCDAFGNLVATKLREFPEDLRAHTQSAIMALLTRTNIPAPQIPNATLASEKDQPQPTFTHPQHMHQPTLAPTQHMHYPTTLPPTQHMHHNVMSQYSHNYHTQQYEPHFYPPDKILDHPQTHVQHPLYQKQLETVWPTQPNYADL